MKSNSVFQKTLFYNLAMSFVIILVFVLLLVTIFPRFSIYVQKLDNKLFVQELQKKADYHYNNLNDLISNLNDLSIPIETNLFMLDSNGQMAAETNTFLSYDQLLKKDNDLEVIQYYVDKEVYSLVVYHEVQHVTNEVQSMLIRFLPILLLVGVLISALISYFYANYLVNPIRELQEKAKQIENMNFDIQKTINSGDEMEELDKSLQAMAKKLNLSINNLEQDLKNVKLREEERKNLLSIVSHELKTPITLLISRSELFLETNKLSDATKDYVYDSLENYSNLNSMINQILTSAKVDNFDYKLNIEDIVLKDLVTSISKDLEINDVSLNIRSKSIIKSDRFLLSLVLKNLIENASKYKSADKIHVSFKNNKIHIKNKIDKEINISKKDLVTAFKQLDDSRQSKGYGLGLYIVVKSLDKLEYTYDIKYNNKTFEFIINL